MILLPLSMSLQCPFPREAFSLVFSTQETEERTCREVTAHYSRQCLHGATGAFVKGPNFSFYDSLEAKKGGATYP